MRRRRSNASGLRAAVAAAAVLCGAVQSAAAQGSLAEEGALFLLVPVGARAVGMGQAVTAEEDGSEAVWWNPAGLARLEKREAAIHHQRGLGYTADAVSLIVPSSLLGVIGLSVHIFDFGEIPSTDIIGTEGGEILTRAFVYAASYATPIGGRVNAGINYKIAQFRVECTGPCPPNAFSVATSTALDLGLQYDADWLVPLTLAAALRNVGPRFQVNDRAQSDGLPARLQIGALYRVGQIQRYMKDAELHVTGDVLGEVQIRRPATHLGTDLIWRKRLHARAGWVFDTSELDGPSIGVGLTAGTLVLDVGQLLHGVSANGQTPPTYLSLRYLF
ncbi:MAG TPA: PorV/PorQ family protein [Gemmatimonadaceae bacterium]|nr:PorV/PorQ family protein [Gemmatimonadaceae bacterium]